MYNPISSVKPGQNKDFQLKLIIFISIIIFTFFILIMRIGYIQIIKNITYSKKSERIKEKTVRVPPIRGRIYSSDNELLATNITSFNIILSPKDLNSDNLLRQNELKYMSDILKINYQEIENRIKENENVNEFIIADNITLNDFIKIKENMDNLPGVTYEEVLYRYYPYNDMLSHVLGYIGPINKDELKVYEKLGYIHSDLIGKSGIEQYYENELRGKRGQKVYSINAKMTIQNEIKEKEILPEPGNELVLTINLKFQKIVEDILADRVGCVVVEKPATGEIIALASYPDYDPNIYILTSEDNKKKRREIILNTKETPLINRTIQSVYPPASVFKIITATAVLHENIVPPSERHYCGGIFRVGIDTKKCWVYPGAHGLQNLTEGIKNSCDIYFYNIAKKVGPLKIKEYASLFNLNKSLDIDLPSEKQGIIPTPEYYKTIGKDWFDGDTMNMIIGQGEVKVTPMQMANMMSIISNKGFSFKPHVLKQIKSSFNGNVIKENKPEKIVDLKNISPNTFNFIENALYLVTKDGTAKLTFMPNPYKIAGKTGTAEVGMGSKKQTHSWFVGYGPIDKPNEERIVVAVLIEFDENSYLRYAANVANMIFYAYFADVDYKESANKMYYPIKDTYRLDGE